MISRRIFVASIPFLAFSRAASANDLIPVPYFAAKYITPKNAPSQFVIADKSEPGDRLIVTGRVTDGQKPLQGVSLYVFHADAAGLYSKGPSNSDEDARLYGALRTDAEGRFRYESIRPIGYSDNGAHIHYVVTKDGHKKRMEELRFADDPKALNAAPDEVKALQAGQRAAMKTFPGYVFAILMPDRDAQGVWRITHDIVLEKG